MCLVCLVNTSFIFFRMFRGLDSVDAQCWTLSLSLLIVSQWSCCCHSDYYNLGAPLFCPVCHFHIAPTGGNNMFPGCVLELTLHGRTCPLLSPILLFQLLLGLELWLWGLLPVSLPMVLLWEDSWGVGLLLLPCVAWIISTLLLICIFSLHT